MPIIFDLIYREYCRARLAEMRKQLLIQAVSDEAGEVGWNGLDPGHPADRNSGRGDKATTKEAPTAT